MSDDPDPPEDFIDELLVFDCPNCGNEVWEDSESCPSCGYWITDAEREAGWRDGSASGRIRTIGLWVLGLATIGMLLLWW